MVIRNSRSYFYYLFHSLNIFLVDGCGNEIITSNSIEHHSQIQANIVLSELPEPPIPLSEIGPIPPPPMFSTPSPTMIMGRLHTLQSNNSIISNMNLLPSPKVDYNEYEYQEENETDVYRYTDDIDSEEEYTLQKNINTMRIEEIPVKEPMLNAVPKKSALKKKKSNEGNGPTTSSHQDTSNRPLLIRQEHTASSMK